MRKETPCSAVGEGLHVQRGPIRALILRCSLGGLNNTDLVISGEFDIEGGPPGELLGRIVVD